LFIQKNATPTISSKFENQKSAILQAPLAKINLDQPDISGLTFILIHLPYENGI